MSANEERFQKAMNQGHSAAWDQMWDQAASFYRQALEEFPDHPKALASLGLALFELQQYDEALAVYRRVVILSPQDPLGLEKVAQICERMGRLNDAIDASLKAADLYVRQNHVDKAIVNWIRVTRFNPEHLLAHTRLAVAYERQGRKAEAVAEYLAVAALVQEPNDKSKAEQSVTHAIQIMPESKEARHALAILRLGRALPKPARTRGGTGPMVIAQVRQMDAGQRDEERMESDDPIIEARQRALVILAEVLFDASEENREEIATRRDMKTIAHGEGGIPAEKIERSKVLLHLGQAITAQSQQNETQALAELTRAIDAGLSHPAALFDTGYLRTRANQAETALHNLQQSVRHPEFTLGSRLLMGECYHKMGRLRDAAVEYLEAMRTADATTVPKNVADDLAQLYDPLIEAQSQEKDETVLESLCKNISAQLIRPGWRQYLVHAREELPPQPEGSPALPLAEMLLQTSSGQVVDSLTQVRQLASQNLIRTATEEAYNALQHAPTYLPLHVQIGELLLQDGRVDEAIEKFVIVAQTYNVRGEATRSTSLLRRIIALSPNDMKVRNQLIDQLTAQGKIDEAIQEYMDMADVYYRLAELDKARTTYMSALRLSQQSRTARSRNVEVLYRMADIDMQRLDWRQAIRMYEQIRTIQPGDEKARAYLIDLNLRMGQVPAAMTELDSYIVYVESNNQKDKAIKMLAGLVADRPDNVELRKRLADLYYKTGRKAEAIQELDAVGDMLLNTGSRTEAVACIKKILSMSPPNAEDYRRLLSQIQNG